MDQEAPEEGRISQRLKRYAGNKNYKDISPTANKSEVEKPVIFKRKRK